MTRSATLEYAKSEYAKQEQVLLLQAPSKATLPAQEAAALKTGSEQRYVHHLSFEQKRTSTLYMLLPASMLVYCADLHHAQALQFAQWSLRQTCSLINQLLLSVVHI